MPMKPGSGESQDDFIGRCMSQEKGSFPDQKQRLAVCFSMWRESSKAEKGAWDESKHPRESSGKPEGGRFASAGGSGASSGEQRSPKQKLQDASKELARAGYKFQSSGTGGSGEWLEYVAMRHPSGTEPDENIEGEGAIMSVARLANGNLRYSVSYEHGFDRPRSGGKKFTSLRSAMRYADELHGIRKEDFEMTNSYQVTKVDDELGLVFGWGIVSSVDGEPYFDVQGDWIPDDAMLKATSEFMLDIRKGSEMHNGEEAGTIVHSLPLTADLAEAFGIDCDRTGWIVGFKPSSPELLEKFRNGEYTGFSIGGNRLKDEYVPDEEE